MFIYQKKLQYPVKIKNTNPKLAAQIITQYGGPKCNRVQKKPVVGFMRQTKCAARGNQLRVFCSIIQTSGQQYAVLLFCESPLPSTGPGPHRLAACPVR